MIDRTDFSAQWRTAIHTKLSELGDEIGMRYVQEMLYRFSIAQFQDTLGFRPAKGEILLKLLSDMQSEFGYLFEQFANDALASEWGDDEINSAMKLWLREFYDNSCRLLNSDVE